MNDVPSLRALGWDEARSREFDLITEPDSEPGRVIAVHRGASIVATAVGEVRAAVAGRLLEQGAGAAPVVGDWVALRRAGAQGVIRSVLPRRSAIVRKVAGFETKEQVLVANVDVVLLVCGLDHDFNVRRIERYLTTAYASGARPVIVLTKADVAEDAGAWALEAEAGAPGVDVLTTSILTGEGLDELAALAAPEVTLALLGSSGVGKSSLVNALAGRAVQRVRDVREDGRGRHTTTHRELVVLPTGGLVIDTPGLRELQLWDVGEGLDDAFADIAALDVNCKFSDCSHRSEPGCAVKAAVASGALDPARLAGYEKLQRELAFLERKRDRRAQAEATRKWRAVTKAARSRPR